MTKLFFAMLKKVSTFAPAFRKKKGARPGGGMVDTVDSKSAVRKDVRVQVPPGVQTRPAPIGAGLILFWPVEK